MVVTLVNVGQSCDGRVSSVEPAVLIHIAVLQMARTVNWVPWVLTTVLTQQYPYRAPRLERWRLFATPLSLLYCWRAMKAASRSAAFPQIKLLFFGVFFLTLRAQQLREQDGVLCQTGCMSVTLVDLFVSKSLSSKSCSYWTFSIPPAMHGARMNYWWKVSIRHKHVRGSLFRFELQTRVCAHAHLSLSRQGGGIKAVGGGGRPIWPITALSYASQNISQGVG